MDLKKLYSNSTVGLLSPVSPESFYIAFAYSTFRMLDENGLPKEKSAVTTTTTPHALGIHLNNVFVSGKDSSIHPPDDNKNNN